MSSKGKEKTAKACLEFENDYLKLTHPKKTN